jgi:hypothetical protein
VMTAGSVTVSPGSRNLRSARTVTGVIAGRTEAGR